MKLPKRAVAKSGPHSGLVSQIPWHQDNGVILPEADESKNSDGMDTREQVHG